jgi:hypothetical protein
MREMRRFCIIFRTATVLVLRSRTTRICPKVPAPIHAPSSKSSRLHICLESSAAVDDGVAAVEETAGTCPPRNLAEAAAAESEGDAEGSNGGSGDKIGAGEADKPLGRAGETDEAFGRAGEAEKPLGRKVEAAEPFGNPGEGDKPFGPSTGDKAIAMPSGEDGES